MAWHPGLAVQQLLGEFPSSSEGRQPPLHRPPSGEHFPDPIRACPARPAPALPVVCLRRACPFLMAWSTFFFLFTISSFRAWTERQTGVNLLHGHLCVLLASTRQILREQDLLAQQGWTTDPTPVQSTFPCCGTYWAFWDQA